MYTVTRVSDEGQEILDTLATGYCPGCPECPTEDQIGLAGDEGYISRFPCDMCGDDLLGHALCSACPRPRRRGATLRRMCRLFRPHKCGVKVYHATHG